MKLLDGWSVEVKFDPRIWVGIFWDRLYFTIEPESRRNWVRLIVCVVPCLPIVFTGPTTTRASSKEGRQ